MSRLIEVQLPDRFPKPLEVRVGDVLLLAATGARIKDGGRAVEVWGPFLSAVVGENGAVVAPEGPPNTVLVRACEPGSVTLEDSRVNEPMDVSATMANNQLAYSATDTAPMDVPGMESATFGNELVLLRPRRAELPPRFHTRQDSSRSFARQNIAITSDATVISKPASRG